MRLAQKKVFDSLAEVGDSWGAGIDGLCGECN